MTSNYRLNSKRGYVVASAVIAGIVLSGCVRAPQSEVGPEMSTAAVVITDHYKEGRVNFTSGRYGLAAKAFHTSLLLEGRRADTYNALGATYDKLSRFDLAQRYYKSALDLDPSSPTTLNNFGYSLFLQGKHLEAVHFFERARRHDGKSAVIQSNLRLAMQSVKPAVVKKQLAAATVAKAVPAQVAPSKVWLERTSRSVHTLISKPKPEVMVKALNTRVNPKLAGVAERPASTKATAVPVAGPVDIRGYGRPIKANWRVAKPQTKPRIQLANVTRQVAVTPSFGSKAAIGAYTFAIANGTGRRHMALRMRGFLTQNGWRTARLRNAGRFSHKHSVVSARPGYEHVARRLAAALPGNVRVTKASGSQSVAIRLILGADLLGFDARLYKEATRG